MRASTIVKLNFLFLALGLSLYFIYSLNTKGLSPGVQAFFGVSPDQILSEVDKSSWKWCDERVAAIIRPEEFKLSQQGSNWVREDGVDPGVVDFAAVERWLAQSCDVPATKVSRTVDESFLPALLVKFVDGQVGIIRKSASGEYSWKGQVFAAPAFDAALEELSRLPEGRRK